MRQIGSGMVAAAVIITLLYLSVQVRASNVASKVEAKLATSGMYTDFLRTLIESPEINDVFVRGREDMGQLNSEEFYRFSNLGFRAFSYFSAGHFQHRVGSLTASDWFEMLAIVRFWLRGKGTQDWWQRLGMHMYGSDFVAFIESEIRSMDSG